MICFQIQISLRNNIKQQCVSQQPALRRTNPQFTHLTNTPNGTSYSRPDEIHAVVPARSYHHRHPCPCRRSEGDESPRPNDKNCLLDGGSVNHSGGRHLENSGVRSTMPPRISKKGIPKVCFVRNCKPFFRYFLIRSILRLTSFGTETCF